MTYTMHLQRGTITRDSDGKVVAPCESTTDPDYIAYIEWINAGNAPDTVTVDTQPPLVPESVSRFQARAALMQAGMLEPVEAMMTDTNPATAVDPFVALAWREVIEFRRDSPMVLALMPALGLTESQLDDLFRFAATINA